MVKLFCIPYSGASATVYAKWEPFLSDEIELIPVELAGHGMRIKEKCHTSVGNSVFDIVETILTKMDEEDYAIWGHSLGSVLTYETYFELMKRGVKPPKHLFFSGRKAPNDVSNKTSFYKLSDKEFSEVVESYGGTTKEVLQNEVLRDLFLPILRADFEIGEKYEWMDKKSKIRCDITIVNGKEDSSVSNIDMNNWKTCSDKSCEVVYVSGGHFFLFEQCELVVGIINKKLNNAAF